MSCCPLPSSCSSASSSEAQHRHRDAPERCRESLLQDGVWGHAWENGSVQGRGNQLLPAPVLLLRGSQASHEAMESLTNMDAPFQGFLTCMCEDLWSALLMPPCCLQMCCWKTTISCTV